MDRREPGRPRRSRPSCRSIPGTPGEPSQTFDHDALGVDVAVHWCLRGPGTAARSFEGALATNLDRGLIYADPIARVARPPRARLRRSALVQDLGAARAAGVRYDRYDADRDATEQAGVTIVGVHACSRRSRVMAARRDGTKRLIVEYDHERNPLGRDDDGAPTTRERDRVTLRAQVGF